MMRSLILAAALLAATPAAARDVVVDLEGVPVAEVVMLLYREVLRTPYVLSPEVYSDRRLVSVRIQCSEEQAITDTKRYLGALGLVVREREGIHQLRYAEVQRQVYVYKPRYRDVSYLQQLVRPLMGADQGYLGGNGSQSLPPGEGIDPSQARPGTAAGLLDSRTDAFVYYGRPETIARLRDVLPTIDTPPGEVDVRATVYEVTSGRQDGSALQLAGKLLAGKTGISLDWSPAANGGGTIAVQSADLSAVAGVLSSDSAFRTVSSPAVRAKSGTQTEFTSGEQVPILSSVSYAGAAGQPVQSVEYRDAGVIFKVRPTVRDTSIDLEIEQELSSFTSTTTGVNTSPTLIKRALKSALSSRSGDVIILGGLTQEKSGGATRGILGLPLERSDEGARVEVLLVLQVVRVPPPAARPVRDYAVEVPPAPAPRKPRRKPLAPAQPLEIRPLVTKG